MQPIDNLVDAELASISCVLTDLDDTLTLDGCLPAAAYSALGALTVSGVGVVIVTGRPAGWCDLMARLWPVTAVVGENGAFYFQYDRQSRQMHRHYQRPESQRIADRYRLGEMFRLVQRRYPGVRLASDQDYRVSDIAIDFAEDVSPPLERSTIEDICSSLAAQGATVKVSSIHVNAWIGDYSKLQMSLRLLESVFAVPASEAGRVALYVGDSPNDEPMFRFFPHSFGVANIRRFSAELAVLPRWITLQPGGHGFVEVAERLLRSRAR